MNLGRHVAEDDAARAYDKAAICARGKDVAKLNFSIHDYSDELEHLQSTTVAELAPLLRCSLFTTDAIPEWTTMELSFLPISSYQ